MAPIMEQSYILALFVLCLGVAPCQGYYTQSSFQLSFPLEPHSAYARLQNTIPYPLSEFTICHWTRVRNISALGAIFSYATDENHNALLSAITPRGSNQVYHQDTPIYETNDSITLHEWVHQCTTWSAFLREFHTFLNGEEVPGFIAGGPPHSKPLKSGGVVIIGQEQDTVGGGFESQQSFHGDISEVHVWDQVLCQDQITLLSQCRVPNPQGNVIAWRQSPFTFGGEVVMSPVTLCDPTCAS